MEQNNKKPYVYICCSAADRELLEKVKKILDAQGIAYIWADPAIAGANFALSGPQLQAATVCLVLVSEKTAASMEVRNILGAVMRLAVRLVLVQSEAVQMKPELQMRLAHGVMITADADMERKLLQALPLRQKPEAWSRVLGNGSTAI